MRYLPKIIRLLPVVFLALLSACLLDFDESIQSVDWQAGDAEAPSPFSIDSASIQDAIDAGDFQGAIDLAVHIFDIDVSCCNGSPQYNSDLDGVSKTDIEGNVEIGQGFFTSPGLLASVIGHEMIHAQQLAEGRWYLEEQGIYMNEVEAYDWELSQAEYHGLSKAEKIEIVQLRGLYYSLLSEDNKALADQGFYVLPMEAFPTPTEPSAELFVPFAV